MDRLFPVLSLFASAFEHGTIEQNSATNISGLSTVRVLQLANRSGTNIFKATTTNWSVIQTNLNTNYSAGAIASVSNFMFNNGLQPILLPQNGLVVQNHWRGYGYAALAPNACPMVINGGLFGGYGDQPADIDPDFDIDQNSTAPVNFNSVPAGSANVGGADPVSLSDGMFTYEKLDLSLGQSEPRGLAFNRYFHGRHRFQSNAGMGYGWSHNYQLNLVERADSSTGLGAGTPFDMAAMLVATRAALDTFSTNSAKELLVSALIAGWGVDQLRRNAVAIQMGNQSIQFTKQPDGRYTEPAGITAELVKTNGVFEMRERHGNTFRFGANGLATEIEDLYGKKLTLSYTNGLVRQVTDAFSRTLTFNYSGGVLSSIQDGTTPSRTVSFSYTNGNLAAAADVEGYSTTFLYDTNRQILAIIDPDGRVTVSNRFDSLGRVKEQLTEGNTSKLWQLFFSGPISLEVNPLGQTNEHFYDERGRWAGRRDALGNRSTLVYDGQNHIVATVSPLMETNRFTFDGWHNVLTSTDPLGSTITQKYDSLHRMTNRVDARGNPTRFTYDSKHRLLTAVNVLGNGITNTIVSSGAGAGQVESTTDSAGFTTSFTYDSYGQPDVTTYPGSATMNADYSTRGDLVARTDARGNTTYFVYNQRRQVATNYLVGYFTNRITYDRAGNLATTVDARGSVTTNLYNATRKLLRVTLPSTTAGSGVITNTFDAAERLVATRDPLGRLCQFSFDAAERLTAVQDPLNRSQFFGYDADGRRIATTNALGNETHSLLSARGELLALTNALNHVLRYAYDANGNLLALTNRRGEQFTNVYDAVNRATSNRSPLGFSTGRAYNSRGLVSSATEPSGDTTTFLYDNRGRLTNRTDTVGTTSFTYDSDNNLLAVREGTNSLRRSYDALGRVTHYTNAWGDVLQFGYDPSGNLTNLVYPDGKTVRYAYDARNQLTTVTDWTNRVTTFEYDQAGQVTNITRPNGTRRAVTYDDAGQTKEIRELRANGSLIALLKHDFDLAGRITNEWVLPVPQTYTESSFSGTYDVDNRLTVLNGGSVSFDSDGNLLTGAAYTNTWDSRNRLVTANYGGTNLAYGYDAEGNRITVTQGTNTTRWIINPSAALSQAMMRVKQDGTKTFYVYGLGLLYEVAETEQIKTYHYDYRGSTVALADGSGVVTDRAEYDAYGQRTYRAGTNDTPFWYNGRYGVQTDVNGLLFMRARYYSAMLKRFLNPDPAGFAGDLNWYAYANGNPVSFFDPFGLGAQEPSGFSWKGVLNGIGNVGRTIWTGITSGAEFLVNKLVGANFGEAWFNLPSAIRNISQGVGRQLQIANSEGLDPQINDNKYGHSLQASGLQRALGLIGAPVIAAGGLGYELFHLFSPGHVQGDAYGYTRNAPFFGLFDGQNPLNWVYDTPGDVMANTIGQLTSILSLPENDANRITFLIPGPNYSSDRAGGYPSYSGDAFWTTIAPPGALNPWPYTKTP